MKSSILLSRIKGNLEPYKSVVASHSKIKSQEINSIQSMVAEYNKNNFSEIMSMSTDESDEEINDEELEDLEMRIDHYFKRQHLDDEEFKVFIKSISCYLSFIAKKPLHPPGIVFSSGTRVFKKHDKYYCTGKSVFINDDYSLCQFCVCEIPNRETVGRAKNI